MPFMLRNRQTKDIGGVSTGQKIILNKPQEGVVLIPSLGIGGFKVYNSNIGLSVLVPRILFSKEVLTTLSLSL